MCVLGLLGTSIRTARSRRLGCLALATLIPWACLMGRGSGHVKVHGHPATGLRAPAAGVPAFLVDSFGGRARMLRADRTREPAQFPPLQGGAARSASGSRGLRRPGRSAHGLSPCDLRIQNPSNPGRRAHCVLIRRSKAGYLSVSGKVNGRPVNLMVDTGAPTSRLDPGEPRSGRGVET